MERAGYFESRWSDPSDPRTYVIIDWVDDYRADAAGSAARLRAELAQRPGYREIRFQPTSRDGWIWVYSIPVPPGRRRAIRIDLLSRRCGILFAVLGSTSPRRFAELRPTFSAISRGIRVRGRRC